VEPFPAKFAASVGVREGGDDEVTGCVGVYVGSDLVDDTDELAPHEHSVGGAGHAVIRAQVGSADARPDDPDYCVGGCL
jgi:hypothetical protein